MKIDIPRRRIALALFSVPLLLVTGCGGREAAPASGSTGVETTRSAEQSPMPPSGANADQAAAIDAPTDPNTGAGDPPLVVFLGDSITAGYGLGEEEAFPALVGAALAERGRAVRVVNAGVSGDTSTGGRERLSWLLRQQPDVLVVELGANDGLRGQPLAVIESNLREIITSAQQRGIAVLLLGMRIPPNYGPEYAEGFAELFARLASELEVPLVPFLLEGVGGVPELNLPDGIHPTAVGHQRLAVTVLPELEKVLAGLTASNNIDEPTPGGG